MFYTKMWKFIVTQSNSWNYLFVVHNPKPCGARELSKYYNLCFDPKIVHGVCAIFRIQCACVTCASLLDKHWISRIIYKK